MELLEYAKSELNRIGKDKDGMQEMINEDILQIIKIFVEQGHSGFSASYEINVLERLLRFKPLSQLTGEEDEWNECSCGRAGIRTFQNKRCSSVFKDVDSEGNIVRCEDIDGIIVSDNGGITWFKSGRFRKGVTFPYAVPNKAEKVYIEYTDDVPPGFTGDEYEIITDKPDRIKALYARKRKEFDETNWPLIANNR